MSKYILSHKGKLYLKFFEDISAIPHGSFNEKAISDFIVKFAEDRNLWYYRDELNNVVIKKPGTPGYENHEPIMLQGHMDMVCEKEPGSSFNFETDPLKLYVEDGWLKAKGTTLGADDGVAVAYILAILDEKDWKHPPLECVIVVQEEAGVYGAVGFDCSRLESKMMIGLDGITEGATTILTAGVIGGDFKKQIIMIPNNKRTFEIKIAGLAGGHGALNIGKEQGNAIKIAARILYYMKKEFKINIAAIRGGTIRNGIAEECEVSFVLDESNAKNAKKIFEEVAAQVKHEHADSDPKLHLTLKTVNKAGRILDEFSSDGLIDYLHLIPTGTYMRSLIYTGLPIASRNLGTINISNDTVIIGYMFRCAKTTMLEDFFEQGKVLADKFGTIYKELYQYSGFEVSPGSQLYKIWQEVYKEATGKEIVNEAVHYGTDAGTFFEKIKGLDIIVVTPTVLDVHRPAERLNLDSFHRTYQYLKSILEKL